MTVVAHIVALAFLIGLLAWILPDTIRDCRYIAVGVRKWIDGRRNARARAARQIQEINEQTNEKITRLQYGYWEAQQRMREELDRDE